MTTFVKISSLRTYIYIYAYTYVYMYFTSAPVKIFFITFPEELNPSTHPVFQLGYLHQL